MFHRQRISIPKYSQKYRTSMTQKKQHNRRKRRGYKQARENLRASKYIERCSTSLLSRQMHIGAIIKRLQSSTGKNFQVWDFQIREEVELTLTSIHNYWKTIALTIWVFVCKVMPLLFNMLSEFVIAFLTRSKWLLKFHGCGHYPQWFWSPGKQNVSLFLLFALCLHWSDGTGYSDLSFLNVQF